MKLIRSLVLALALGLAFSNTAHAVIIQVTTVGATASTILTPGKNVHIVCIQNNGSGDVRLTIDGGSTNSLTNPTATTGYLLVHGAQLILTYPGGNQQPKVRAILVTGTTTTLDIVTDDSAST